MEETIGKASLRDAAIGTGIAVDKMLAGRRPQPLVQVANVDGAIARPDYVVLSRQGWRGAWISPASG
jgi:hypothetical protein